MHIPPAPVFPPRPFRAPVIHKSDLSHPTPTTPEEAHDGGFDKPLVEHVFWGEKADHTIEGYKMITTANRFFLNEHDYTLDDMLNVEPASKSSFELAAPRLALMIVQFMGIITAIAMVMSSPTAIIPVGIVIVTIVSYKEMKRESTKTPKTR